MKSTLTTLALALAALSAQAGTFDAWSLNGSANLLDAGNTLRLASDGYQAGSAYAASKISLAHDFSVAFSFKIAGGSGADGLTFLVQDSTGGSSALGFNGGWLGYESIGNSVAFVYDTWENGVDTDRVAGPNTSVAFDGALNGWGGNTVGTAYALREQVLYSWVDYVASTKSYSMYISDTAVKPLTATETFNGALSALSGSTSAYIGFTGATGGATDNHDILSVNVTAVAVPEADTLALALVGLPVVFGLARRRARQAAAQR